MIDLEGQEGSIWLVKSGERAGWEVEDRRVRIGGWSVNEPSCQLHPSW